MQGIYICVKLQEAPLMDFLNLAIIFWELRTIKNMDKCSAFMILYSCDFTQYSRIAELSSYLILDVV